MSVLLGKRIKELRTSSGLTQQELCDKINELYGFAINKSMISKWENGKEEPYLQYAKSLALFFRVSLDYIIGLSSGTTSSPAAVQDLPELSPDEYSIIERYRSLNDEGKDLISNQLDIMISSGMYDKKNTSHCLLGENA